MGNKPKGHEHIVENLPAIMAAASAVAAGLYGYAKRLPNSIIYRNMCAFLVVCFLLGMLARHTIRKFQSELAPPVEEPEPAVDELLYGQGADAGPEEGEIPETASGGAGAGAGSGGMEGAMDGAGGAMDGAGGGMEGGNGGGSSPTGGNGGGARPTGGEAGALDGAGGGPALAPAPAPAPASAPTPAPAPMYTEGTVSEGVAGRGGDHAAG